MAGTKAGGQKAAAKNLAKDPNFYAKIGSKGGKNGHTGGFAAGDAGFHRRGIACGDAAGRPLMGGAVLIFRLSRGE